MNERQLTSKFWGKPNTHGKPCCYCQVFVPKASVTSEHIIPKSRGGRITAPCCYTCNQEKKNMDLVDYIFFLHKQLKYMRKPKKIKRTEIKIRNAVKFLLLLYPGEYDFIFVA